MSRKTRKLLPDGVAVVDPEVSSDNGAAPENREGRQPREKSPRRSAAVLSDGGVSEDISLRNALAEISSIFSEKEFETRLSEVSVYSDVLGWRSYWFFNITSKLVLVLYVGLALFVLAMAVELFRPGNVGEWVELRYSWNVLFLILGVFLLRHVIAYGVGTPKVPTEKPLALGEHGALGEAVAALLRELRMETGIKAYHYRWAGLKKSPRPVNRRTFFGKYCHLLFSEHTHMRELIPLYGAPFLCSSDLFIRKSEFRELMTRLKPKQNIPGRPSCGLCEGALLALSSYFNGETKLISIPESEAVAIIKGKLQVWYDDHPHEDGVQYSGAEVEKQALEIRRGLKHNARYIQK